MLPFVCGQGCQCDTVLILDRSGSINDGDAPNPQYTTWNNIKAMTHKIVDDLPPGKNGIGLVSFSTDATLDAALTTDKSIIHKAIDRLPNAGGVTNSPAALGLARTAVLKGVASCQTIVFLTDGKPYLPPSNPAAATVYPDTSAQAKLIRDDGTYILGIGVSGADMTFMTELVGPTAKVGVNPIYVKDFSSANLAIIQKAVVGFCPTDRPPCDCDVVFALDTSPEMAGGWFDKEIGLIRDVARFSSLGASGVSMGVVSFSDTSKSRIPLTDSSRSFYDGLSQITFDPALKPTSKRIDLGEDQARQLSNGRTTSCKTLVLLSNGRTDLPPIARTLATDMKNSDYLIFTLLYGNTSVDTQLMTDLASYSSKQTVYLSPLDANNIATLSSQLLGYCPTFRCACNILVAIQSTSNLTDFRKQIGMTLDLSYMLDLQTTGLEMGVIVYSDTAKLVQAFTSNRATLSTSINSIQPLVSAGAPDVTKAFDIASTQGKTKTSTCKTLFVFSDGTYSPVVGAVLGLQKLVSEGFRVYAFGVGSAVKDSPQVKTLNSDPTRNAPILADGTTKDLIQDIVSNLNCSDVCGNGIRVLSEQCDDGNNVTGDGCSNCRIDNGWVCIAPENRISSCSQVCGNGLISVSEQCDDGNRQDGDGCSSTCKLEPGWTCKNIPSVCVSVCGDGIRTINEVCDDGDRLDGNGCSKNCNLIENGWDCTTELLKKSYCSVRNCACDMVIILDRSGSIADSDTYDDETWNKITNMTKNIISVIPLSEDGSHIGLVSFSWTATIDMPLTTNKDLLNDALIRMAHPNGVTNTPDAFRKAGLVLAQGNRSCQALVLLTDGKPNLPPASMDDVTAEATRESEILRNNGVNLLCIGVGSDIDSAILSQFVGPSAVVGQNPLIVDQFSDKNLMTIRNAVIGFCPAVKSKCQCDVVFVVDMSYTISDKTFYSMMDFVRRVAGQLEFGKNGARAGVVTFQDTAKLNVPITMYSRTFYQQANTITYTAATNNIKRPDLGLELAARSMYKTVNSTCRSIIILTDGATSDIDALQTTSDKLESGGYHVVAVGFGNNVNNQTLDMISTFSDVPTMYQKAPLLQDIPKFAEGVVHYCPRVRMQCNCDIIFLILSYKGISNDLFKKQVDYVYNAILDIYLDIRGVMVSVVVYGETAQIIQPLSASIGVIGDTLNKLKDAGPSIVDEMQYPHIGLNTALDILNKRSRLSGCMNVMVMSDGYYNMPSAAKDKVKELSDSNIYVFATGLEARTPLDALIDLSSSSTQPACTMDKGIVCVDTMTKKMHCFDVCGDGMFSPATEECDDGNLIAGDGCDKCKVERGWGCKSVPLERSICSKTCGNIRLDPEECDDGNLIDGDGCSSTCQIEKGWKCPKNTLGAVSACDSVCGDGYRLPLREDCDDGNSIDGDGCSKVCKVEIGYKCQDDINKKSICNEWCGDGVLTKMETCDDGNNLNGDGCSASCLVETGWSCSNQTMVKSLCSEICGNGIITGSEKCDDGNAISGDGCSSTCIIETGWVCDPVTLGSKSICNEVCGNGIRTKGEACDDGNLINGDGCSSTCIIEVGWSCTGTLLQKSVCGEICGDGIKSAKEECDDNNLISGDGCSPTCTIEPGWSCTNVLGAKSVCKEGCGDGVMTASEKCDDKNIIDGDGCSSSCQIEPGWVCNNKPSEPSFCEEVCGNGIKTISEKCDDGNLKDGDGCDGGCQEERGWGCVGDNGQKSVCKEICGDGIQTQSEKCDDGNDKDDDGCDSKCKIDPGYECKGIMGSLSTCSPVCGDGIRTVKEECDDGNKVSGDGCDYDPVDKKGCLIENGWECLAPLLVKSICKEKCGDGLITNNEPCDDGNLINGDGCSSTCLVENGWDCNPRTLKSKSKCFEVCGNGIRTPGEECDDGNIDDLDGCSRSCVVETGWGCVDSPLMKSICSEICGNGFITKREECDDGNKIDGDGCSSSCTVEIGWDCSPRVELQKSTCRERCGNGIRTKSEECDDGNNFNNDGCSSTCTIDKGWVCEAPLAMRSNCSELCGNGIVTFSEGCDDHNTRNGDGCSSNCKVELGWDCSPRVLGAGSTCNEVCGDGILTPGEQCDDGNRNGIGNNVDGCSPDCRKVDIGWECTKVPLAKSECKEVCGNGIITLHEDCDDGNVVAGDGCSATCGVERGWDCGNRTIGSLSVCNEVCGNGIKTKSEECDDGDLVDNNGCTNACKIEKGWECDVPNLQKSTCKEKCGNGIITVNEYCDDGNIVNDDGCNNNCNIEIGWDCGLRVLYSKSICIEKCGNGIRTKSEGCDDGNNNNGDGCSATCSIETGWSCKAPLLVLSNCTEVCGNKFRTTSEACDDGNLIDGDGCNSTCGIEWGWGCSGKLLEQSNCYEICGNGIRTKSEACDDGNVQDWDGCAWNCTTVNRGWRCNGTYGERSVCGEICGNGVRTPSEACDDGNRISGDGCSSNCREEIGYRCIGDYYQLSVCNEVCGDAIRTPSEECDDGNTERDDGCSSNCGLEPGWNCTTNMWTKSYCYDYCGNGNYSLPEECDDGNRIDGDGCSSRCKVEIGYRCINPRRATSWCFPVCGDAVWFYSEGCDDGNNIDGDGCSFNCSIEGGWNCTNTYLKKSICKSNYISRTSTPTPTLSPFPRKDYSWKPWAWVIVSGVAIGTLASVIGIAVFANRFRKPEYGAFLEADEFSEPNEYDYGGDEYGNEGNEYDGNYDQGQEEYGEGDGDGYDQGGDEGYDQGGEEQGGEEGQYE